MRATYFYRDPSKTLYVVDNNVNYGNFKIIQVWRKLQKKK